MSNSNGRVVKPVLAAAAAFVAVLALSASAGAAPVAPFREVAVGAGVAAVRSDGVRFAWGQPRGWASAVRVFDTLRSRSFRLEAPARGCAFVSVGGGSALWSCGSPPRILLTDLATRRIREPEGLDQVERDLVQAPWYLCPPREIGWHWIALSCGSSIGPRAEFFLNHRTGGLTEELETFRLWERGSPFIDLDYVALLRPYCAPLGQPADGSHAPPYLDYAPPFALHAPLGPGPYGPTGTRSGSIQLRRCGTRRTEILSGCRFTDCRTPQLGSRYVTWGEHKRVYAYLPSIRRRVLVGRAPTAFLRGRKLSVAHTCNRIFARWGFTIFVARFEPARGAPPCQSRR